MNNIESARQSLNKQLDEFEGEISKLTGELGRIRANKRRVLQALKVLGQPLPNGRPVIRVVWRPTALRIIEGQTQQFRLDDIHRSLEGEGFVILKGTVTNFLSELEKAGRIYRAKRGVWALNGI